MAKTNNDMRFIKRKDDLHLRDRFPRNLSDLMDWEIVNLIKIIYSDRFYDVVTMDWEDEREKDVLVVKIWDRSPIKLIFTPTDVTLDMEGHGSPCTVDYLNRLVEQYLTSRGIYAEHQKSQKGEEGL